jgi:hypothetical protein
MRKIKVLLVFSLFLWGCDSGQETVSFDGGGVQIENMGSVWFESVRTTDSVTRYGYIFANAHNSSSIYDYRVDSVVYRQFYSWQKYNNDDPDLILKGETGLIGVLGNDWPPRQYAIFVHSDVVKRKIQTDEVNYLQVLVSVPPFTLHPTRQTWFWRIRIYSSRIGGDVKFLEERQGSYEQK